MRLRSGRADGNRTVRLVLSYENTRIIRHRYRAAGREMDLLPHQRRGQRACGGAAKQNYNAGRGAGKAHAL